MSRGDNRSQNTGRFSYQGQWHRLCVCGHALGDHAAEAPHDCLKGDCDCEKFRPAREKR